MKKITKFLVLVVFLGLIGIQFSFSQSNRDWWNSLPPAWKKIIQKQELKGKNIDPTDEQLDRIVKIKFIDASNNLDIESLTPIAHLEYLEVLRCNKSGIKSLEGIENLIYLKEVDCSDNDNINSLIPISNLTNLQKLYCGNTMIKELKPIKDLKNLQVLDVHFATVSELIFIGTLSNLEKLDVSQNQSLFTLNGIDRLKKLSELRVNDTKINELLPLSWLYNLELLDCSNTSIQTLKALQNLKNLKDLNCSDTKIKGSSFDYIMGLKTLERFRCVNNEVSKDDKEQVEAILKKANPEVSLNITIGPKR